MKKLTDYEAETLASECESEIRDEYDLPDNFEGDCYPEEIKDIVRDLTLGYAEEEKAKEEMLDIFRSSAESYLEDKIRTEDGGMYDYDDVIGLMDDEIREELHHKLAPCTNQVFFDAYVSAHSEKFGENFAEYLDDAAYNYKG
jgi:hypothetical protein